MAAHHAWGHGINSYPRSELGGPDALLLALSDHHDLGIQTEALSDGLMNLVERGVDTGTRKQQRSARIEVPPIRPPPAHVAESGAPSDGACESRP